MTDNPKKGDQFWTPDWVAADIVRYFQPEGRVLEPARGGGAFMRQLGPDALWCEITEGRDFFDWHEHVDWIVTNPPYSMVPNFLRHCLEVADNIVLLIPVRNVLSGYGLMKEWRLWGGIAAIRWYGGGSRINFPMGNPIGATYWKRGHRGAIRETFWDEEAWTGETVFEAAS